MAKTPIPRFKQRNHGVRILRSDPQFRKRIERNRKSDYLRHFKHRDRLLSKDSVAILLSQDA